MHPKHVSPKTHFGLRYYACCLSIVLSLLTSFAFAQGRNTIESINAITQQGGKVVLRVNFKDPLTALPAGFSVTNPARIALDLQNVGNGLGKNSVEIGEGDVRSVSVVEVGNRTRLVVNLASNLSYTSALEGKSLVVAIDPPSQGALKENAQVTKFAEAPPASSTQRQGQSIRDIDFRRGANGEGRVIVDLSSPNTGIDIRQQGKQVIVDFVNTTVPRNLVRRLDVLDFGTPVRSIDIIDQGSATKMLIEPKGLWDYSAYQTDTQFIVEVKQIKEDPNKLVQGVGYSGEKLSLNFQNIEVRAVLQVIADFTGLNIITSDTVGGSLTLRLKDVPWDQALDIILQAKSLAKRKNGNVVLIAPSDELAAKDKADLEGKQQIVDLEPLRTESIIMAYAKASDIHAMLTNKDQKFLSKRGSANVDVRTNTLFIQDVPSRLDEVRRLLTQLDVPVRQVLIEARIVIADDRYSKQLGARFGVGSGANNSGRNIGVSGNLNQSGQIVLGQAPSAGDGLLGRDLNVNLPVAGAAGSLALSILNLGNSNVVNLELSALEADNRGKVVSSPRVITADRRKAVITQGTEIPYFTQAASGGTTIAFKAAVLSLDVAPQITPDDKIILDIDIKKDQVGQLISFLGGTVPSIDTRTLKTQIVVDNGDTAVLGGIFEQTTRTDVTKVPLLGDLPFIGAAFRSTTKVDNKTELLLFITPRIIKDQLTIR